MCSDSPMNEMYHAWFEFKSFMIVSDHDKVKLDQGLNLSIRGSYVLIGRVLSKGLQMSSVIYFDDVYLQVCLPIT